MTAASKGPGRQTLRTAQSCKDEAMTVYDKSLKVKASIAQEGSVWTTPKLVRIAPGTSEHARARAALRAAGRPDRVRP